MRLVLRPLMIVSFFILVGRWLLDVPPDWVERFSAIVLTFGAIFVEDRQP